MSSREITEYQLLFALHAEEQELARQGHTPEEIQVLIEPDGDSDEDEDESDDEE